jgi:hypothetical protein
MDAKEHFERQYMFQSCYFQFGDRLHHKGNNGSTREHKKRAILPQQCIVVLRTVTHIIA